MKEKFEQELLAILKEKLNGKESNPLYFKWIKDEMEIVAEHNNHLLPELERFVPLSYKKVLDFGCGTAGSSVAMALKGAIVAGVEPNALSVKAARVRISGHSLDSKISILHLEDTSHLPFADKSFDVCVCYSVLEYIPKDRNKYLLEMLRVLKPGGILFIGGTSNGIYPIELHHEEWFVHWFRKPDDLSGPRGSSYWEIVDALKCEYVECLNLAEREPDGLDRFIGRMTERKSKGKELLKERCLISLLKLVRMVICPISNAPVEAYLPWLDLCFKKKEESL